MAKKKQKRNSKNKKPMFPYIAKPPCGCCKSPRYTAAIASYVDSTDKVVRLTCTIVDLREDSIEETLDCWIEPTDNMLGVQNSFEKEVDSMVNHYQAILIRGEEPEELELCDDCGEYHTRAVFRDEWNEIAKPNNSIPENRLDSLLN